MGSKGTTTYPRRLLVTRGRRIAIGIASGLTAVTALTWLGIQELGANQAQSGPGSVTHLLRGSGT